MNRIIMVSLLLCVTMIFTSCKTNDITKDYPSLKKQNNIIRYTNIDEVFSKMTKDEKTIIVFGFKRCPWCQMVVEHINSVALTKNYKEVLYLDILEMRDDETSKEHEKYLKLYDLIKEDIGSPEKIFAPTIIVVENKKIKGFHEGTTKDHIKVDGNLPEMTNEQIENLKTILTSLF